MIKINCMIGASFGIFDMSDDEKILPYISLANIACGLHISDSKTLDKSVLLAKKYNLVIGAQPSYKNFTSNSNEIINIVLTQLEELQALCIKYNTQVSYIKPYGMLYEDMMLNENIFRAILISIKKFNKKLNLMIISTPNNEYYKNIAKEYGIQLLFEVLVDRNYNKDGTLISENSNDVMIQNVEDIVNRVNLLKEFGYIKTLEGKKLYIQADSICINSDNPKIIELLKATKETLDVRI